MTQTMSAVVTRRLTRDASLAVAISILMTLAAKISVPFYPVPMTLQGFVAVLAGLVLGPRLAMAAMGLYLMQGAAGLPVFTGTPLHGIGLAYMVGPTGGYLLGFVLAAGAAGWMAARGWHRGLPGAALTSVLAMALIYVPGLLWLGALTGFGPQVLATGLLPFIPGDLVKVALAALVATVLCKFKR